MAKKKCKGNADPIPPAASSAGANVGATTSGASPPPTEASSDGGGDGGSDEMTVVIIIAVAFVLCAAATGCIVVRADRWNATKPTGGGAGAGAGAGSNEMEMGSVGGAPLRPRNSITTLQTSRGPTAGSATKAGTTAEQQRERWAAVSQGWGAEETSSAFPSQHAKKKKKKQKKANKASAAARGEEPVYGQLQTFGARCARQHPCARPFMNACMRVSRPLPQLRARELLVITWPAPAAVVLALGCGQAVCMNAPSATCTTLARVRAHRHSLTHTRARVR